MKPSPLLSHERSNGLVRLDLGVRTPSDENGKTTTTFLVRIVARGDPREAPRDTEGSRNTGRVPEGVVHANWNPRNRQVKVNWNKPGNSNAKLGARPAIVVLVLLLRLVIWAATDVFHPSAEHFTDPLKIGTHLEILGRFNELQFEAHPIEQFQQLAFRVGLDERRFAKRPRQRIRLENQLEERKDVFVDRLTKRVTVGLRELVR